MRTGRPKVALILTDDERQRLDSLAHRSRSAPQVARRARIILACAEGTRQQGRRATPARDAGDGLQMARPVRAAAAGRAV